MEVTLSVDEREFLAQVLQERHRELLHELFRTDDREFKKLLRAREQLLESLLNKLGVKIQACA
ncbi:MAG: hypothetical protein LAN37_09320 [Acidobacteriia bacterium]|nr:hypothetical protein [Terriglobia bacterium]